MFNVYCIMVSSTLPGIEEAFSETKDRLHEVFGILTSGGGYQHSPGTTNEVHQVLVEKFSKGRNKEECCVKFDGLATTWEGLLSGGELNISAPDEMKGNGFKYVKKMLKETGETIIKQLAEVADPNIRVASGIRNGLKAIGLCNPPHLAFFSALLFPPPLGWGPMLTPIGGVYLILWEREPENCDEKPTSPTEDFDCSTLPDCNPIVSDEVPIDTSDYWTTGSLTEDFIREYTEEEMARIKSNVIDAKARQDQRAIDWCHAGGGVWDSDLELCGECFGEWDPDLNECIESASSEPALPPDEPPAAPPPPPPPCTPNCDYVSCGPSVSDGCGGSCGCGAGKICENGICKNMKKPGTSMK